jgi:hypothetical protein
MLAAASVPSALPAQSVLARVVGVEREGPLSGVIVSLLDAQGTVLESHLTSREGSAAFTKVIAGDYRLRAQMIGRETVQSDIFRVADEVMVRTIELPYRPITLQGIDVDGGSMCARNQAGAQPTFQVWDEARKALLAAQITQSDNLYRFQVVKNHRSKRPSRESVDTTFGEGHDPFRSLAPDELEREGYLRFYANFTYELYGPNTDVFLSRGFERTHCFTLRRDGDHPAQIGLRFTVARGRDVADIDGTLWLDETSSELRSLEFRYRNLTTLIAAGDSGGQMEYQRLDGGSWVVRRWRLYTAAKEEEAEVIRVEPVPPLPGS